MDATPWLQDVGMVKQPSSALEVSSNTRPPPPPPPSHLVEKRARPQKEQALNCPRCNSTNTKFCYYNNYSLTQPRYFCKTCRRYWTEGGSLRNVPVGGGSRKNKRSASCSAPSTSISTPSKKLQPDHHNMPPPSLENPKFLEGHDLNLSFPHHALSQGDFSARFPALKNSPSTDGLSAMELLRSGGLPARGMGSFLPMPMQDVVYPQGGFVLQDFRSSTVGFPVEGIGVNTGAGASTNGGGYENMQEMEGGNGGRVLFPFEDLSQVPPNSGTAAGFDQRQGDSSGFWNGVMGGGGASW